MCVRNVSVFWKFKNVLKNINDTVTVGSSTVSFGEGCWTFGMISKKLGENGVQLERNRHDNTCKIFSRSNNVSLKNFASLLGFPANTVVQANAWTKSPSNVNVNLGLRYVTVECNCVDTDKNLTLQEKEARLSPRFP